MGPRVRKSVATRQFVAERDDGTTVVVLQGATFKATDPVVRKYAENFEAPTTHARRADAVTSSDRIEAHSRRRV